MYTHLYARLDPNQGCTKATCDPIWSIYGYRPSLPFTILFLTIFALSALAFLIQGLHPRTRSKTWFFTAAMTIGSSSEVLGYIAKLLLYNDPFSDLGFKMNVVLLTFAPAFYAAAIYATLAQICLALAPELSRLRPRLYTRIFISCDVVSIILQAAGGGIASAAPDFHVLEIGDNIMIAGLATQVATLLVFGVLAADYAYAVYKNQESLRPATAELRRSWRFKAFVVALWVAYLGIQIRCCYRVAELCEGWGSPTMRNQGLFIGLDSLPVGVAAMVLNVCHPGWWFPVVLRGVEERGRSEVVEVEVEVEEKGKV
jgi:hypothetical protein